MNEEFESKLYKIDPVFFEEVLACKDGKMNEMNTCMYWGCECGDGWFKPLEKFVNKVKIINDIAKNYNTKFVCEQLKEKYGELRVYYKTCLINVEKNDKQTDKQVDVLVDMFEDALKKAEDDCWNVCEWCGAEGGHRGENLITTSGWISRICKKCAKEQQEHDVKFFDQHNNQDYVPRITLFRDAYYFLNPFHIDQYTFKNKDNYYHSIIEAFFCEKDPVNKDIYQKIGSFENDKRYPYLIKDIANKFGFKYEDNSDDYKLLKDIVKAKFSYEWNEELKKELMETKGKLLQNMGYHCDNILGHCVCENCKDKEHKDLYAKILMEVRDEFLNE